MRTEMEVDGAMREISVTTGEDKLLLTDGKGGSIELKIPSGRKGRDIAIAMIESLWAILVKRVGVEEE